MILPYGIIASDHYKTARITIWSQEYPGKANKPG
jgi:hypothetical protein